MTTGNINKVHLSPAQRQVCIDFRDGFTDRPEYGVYAAYSALMHGVNPRLKPKAKAIPNVVRGFASGEVKLLEGFNALTDLPEGWAVSSRHDSGGNHIIEPAGDAVLRSLWNCWPLGSLLY